MKFFFTILILFLSLSTTYSQLDFELTPILAYGQGSADDDDFTAHSMIKNLSDQTIVIAWQRITNDIPQDWQSYVCSNVTCAPPDISMGTFSLIANDSTNLDCHFVPNEIAGTGTVEIRFFLIPDTSQVIVATYHGSAEPVSTAQVLRDKVKVFPNPATDYLSVEGEAFHHLELYSNNGRLIQTFKSNSRIDISTLTNGMYFLKLYNQDNKLISINTFQKINSKQ